MIFNFWAIIWEKRDEKLWNNLSFELENIKSYKIDELPNGSFLGAHFDESDTLIDEFKSKKDTRSTFHFRYASVVSQTLSKYLFSKYILGENIFIRVRKIFINNFYRFHKWWNYSIFQKRKSHFEEDTSTEKDFLFFRENQRKIAPWRVQITVQNLQT